MHGSESTVPLNVDQMILIVVGAHLKAEMTDRPLAYRLRERMLLWLDEDSNGSPCEIVVCTDLWYLNADELRSRFAEVCPNKMCQVAETFAEALELAERAVGPGDLVCVTGSFHLVGEAKRRLDELGRERARA